MVPVVIDTNVLLVANGSHDGASTACRMACIARLSERQKAGVVVVDDARLLLGEYQNKTRPNQPKGVGDVFLKWLLQNQANAARVHQVRITSTGLDSFAEFPDATLQSEFDASDRKFVAVANAHPDKPPIWQAADSKWLKWWQRLDAAGVKVDFLCPDDARRFFARKFPNEAVPAFPAD